MADDSRQRRIVVAAAVLILLLVGLPLGGWMTWRWLQGGDSTIVINQSAAGGQNSLARTAPIPTPTGATGETGLGQALNQIGRALARPAVVAPAPTTQPAGTMDLLVVDSATGRPLAGMGILSGYSKDRFRGLTATNGHVFPPLPTGTFNVFNVAVRGKKYVPKRLWWTYGQVASGNAIPEHFTMEMEKGTTIGGKVVDEAGRPVVGADVQVSLNKNYGTPNVYYDGNGAQGFRTIKTGDDGTWTVTAVPVDCDQMQIGVSAAGYVSDLVGLAEYTPHSELYNQTATFTLGHGVAVTGTVIGPDGKAISGANVFVGEQANTFGGPAPAATDSGGNFSVQMIPGQEAVLTAVAKGFAPEMKVFTVQAQPAAVAMQLETGHRLTVKVIDPTSRPVARAYVQVVSWRGKHTLNEYFATNVAGEVIWDDAPADAVHIAVQASTFQGVGDVAVTAGETEATVQLKPPLRIHGTVTDAQTGTAITSVKVMAGIYIGEGEPIFWASVVPTTDGKYEFVNGAARNPGIELRAEAEGYETAETRVVKSDEGDVTLDIKMNAKK